MPIIDIIEATFKDLINAYRNTETNTKLKFPCYRDSGNKIRVSEQELRFCFASVIEKGPDYRYSVETPTLTKYSFSGTKEMSAQTDLSIWSIDGTKKLFNVEFKAHNAPVKSIDKDIKKLIMEELEGVWFHLLKNNRSNTFTRLADKFKNALRNYNQYRNKDVIFAICILEKNIGIIGKLFSSITKEDDINTFFDDGSKLISDPSVDKVGLWEKFVF